MKWLLAILIACVILIIYNLSFVSAVAPVVNDVSILPITPFDFNSLTGVCNVSDSDSSLVIYDYKWFKNGVEIVNSSYNGGNQSYYYQETADSISISDDDATGYLNVNYTKKSWDDNIPFWLISQGTLAPYNVSAAMISGCWNSNNNSLILRIASEFDYLHISYTLPFCYNGSNWVGIGSYDYTTGGGGSLNSENSSALTYDGNWSTYSFYYVAGDKWYNGINSGAINKSRIFEEGLYWNSSYFASPDNYNISNLTSSNINPNDNLTFSCRSFDGVDYSNWSNSTVKTIHGSTYLLNSFSDGSTAGNVSFNSSVLNSSRLIQAPVGSVFNYAFINFKGFPFEIVDDSEDANATVGCSSNCDYGFDENWLTPVYATNIYENYSIPVGANHSANLEYKYYVFSCSYSTLTWFAVESFNSSGQWQLLVNNSCYTYDSDYCPTPSECHPRTNVSIPVSSFQNNTLQLRFTPRSLITAGYYESKIFWNYSAVNLSVNVNDINVYSGNSTLSSVSVNLNVSLLNSIFAVNSSANVSFFSVSPGVVEYSNINISYNSSNVADLSWSNLAIWSNTIFQTQSVSLVTPVFNNGSYDAVNCSLVASGRAADYFSYSPSVFNLSRNESVNVTLYFNALLDSPATAFDTSYVDISCSDASSSGSVVHSNVDFPMLFTVVFKVFGGSSSGSGTVTLINKSEFSTVFDRNNFDVYYVVLPFVNRTNRVVEIGTNRVLKSCEVLRVGDFSVESVSCFVSGSSLFVVRDRPVVSDDILIGDSVSISIISVQNEVLTVSGNIRTVNLESMIGDTIPFWVVLFFGFLLLLFYLYFSYESYVLKKLNIGDLFD